jgi:hypothetical protein
MQTARIQLGHIPFDRIVFWCEWVLLGAALAAYTYFIVFSVVHVVLRQELTVSIQTEQTHVSDLEGQYLAQQTAISRATADQMGLVALKPSAYVSVGADSSRLTRRP